MLRNLKWRLARFRSKLRPIKWFLQKVFSKDHISEDELFSLDYTIAKFVLPRLRYYVKDPVSFPCIDGDWSFEKWKAILEKMCFFFEYAVANGEGTDFDLIVHYQKDNEIEDFDFAQNEFLGKVEEGKALFCKYYFDLWT